MITWNIFTLVYNIWMITSNIICFHTEPCSIWSIVSFPTDHDIEIKFYFSSESLHLTLVQRNRILESSFQMTDSITLASVDQL